MDDKKYLMDIAGLILSIIMIVVVAIILNISSKQQGGFKIPVPEDSIEQAEQVQAQE